MFAWLRKRKDEPTASSKTPQFNTVVSNIMAGSINDMKRMDEHGRVECRRCGVVYKPRTSMFNSRSCRNYLWDEEPVTPPYPSDESVLVNKVHPQDFCTACEEHLTAVRERLLECLKEDA